MSPQVACLVRGKFTFISFVQFFSIVRFQVSPQCNRIRSRIYIGCFFFIILYCAFSNVSSNRLPKKMQSYTACICWNFPHCVFAYVPSSCLPGKRQIHICCICSSLIHCAFSHVSLNCLPERMQSHIGCICSTFN